MRLRTRCLSKNGVVANQEAEIQAAELGAWLTSARDAVTLSRRTKGEYENCCGTSERGRVGTGGTHSGGFVDASCGGSGAGFVRGGRGRCGAGRRISDRGNHGADGAGFVGAHDPGTEHSGGDYATRRKLRLCGCLGCVRSTLGGGVGGGVATAALGARRRQRCGDGGFAKASCAESERVAERGCAESDCAQIRDGAGKATGTKRGWLVPSAQ